MSYIASLMLSLLLIFLVEDFRLHPPIQLFLVEVQLRHAFAVLRLQSPVIDPVADNHTQGEDQTQREADDEFLKHSPRGVAVDIVVVPIPDVDEAFHETE